MVIWDNIKNFKKSEFVSPDNGEEDMDIRLLTFLDAMRASIGLPIKITSGYRTRKHNYEIGGSPHSSHMLGLAVDIACDSSWLRWKIVDFAMSWNSLTHIIRLGIAKDFIHLDIDPAKPHPIIWVY